MSSISISRWTRKHTNRPRFYITDGREPLGTVYQSKGVFSAVDPDGRLIGAHESLTAAANALCPATGPST
jgi:hypothetical protein